MDKKQYRAIVRAQKRQNKPCGKLIHLLINYRSHARWGKIYPDGFFDTMLRIKQREWDFDGMGVFNFHGIVGKYRYHQPFFHTYRLGESKRRVKRNENDDNVPF